MEFTWRHIILLAEKMFCIDYKEVARRLDVNPSTIYRHRQENDNSCFYIPSDVYEELFAPSNPTPESLNDALSKMKATLNDDCFPAEVRNLPYNDYKLYILHLLRLAEKSNEAKKERRSKQDVSPEEVFIPDEFAESFVDYSVADFIKLNPVDLIDERHISLSLTGDAPDGMRLIRDAIRFVKYMERIMKQVEQEEIAIWDKRFNEFIAAFVRDLREYIDFLLHNSPYPDLNCSQFTVKPSDVDEFERKATEYRTNLQFFYKKVLSIRGCGDAFNMFSNFPWGI